MMCVHVCEQMQATALRDRYVMGKGGQAFKYLVLSGTSGFSDAVTLDPFNPHLGRWKGPRDYLLQFIKPPEVLVSDTTKSKMTQKLAPHCSAMK